MRCGLKRICGSKSTFTILLPFTKSTNAIDRQDMTIYCFRLVLELNRLFNGEEWVYKG